MTLGHQKSKETDFSRKISFQTVPASVLCKLIPNLLPKAQPFLCLTAFYEIRSSLQNAIGNEHIIMVDDRSSECYTYMLLLERERESQNSLLHRSIDRYLFSICVARVIWFSVFRHKSLSCNHYCLQLCTIAYGILETPSDLIKWLVT